MRAHSMTVTGVFLFGLTFLVTSQALAAEADTDYEKIIQELQAEEGLTEAEAREVAGLAAGETGSGSARDLPEAGDKPGTPSVMTAQEKALADKVGTRADQLGKELASQGLSEKEIATRVDSKIREEFKEEFSKAGFDPKEYSAGDRDDARLKELSERGVPGMDRAQGLETRGGASDQAGRETAERAGREHAERSGREQAGRETAERAGREQAERAGREHAERGGRETAERAGREVERPTMEREAPQREAVERPTMEREAPQREAVERPAVEREAPQREAVERPTMERETPEAAYRETPEGAYREAPEGAYTESR